MKVFFDQLFDYNFYCNKKIIEVCTALDVVPEKSHRLFCHMLNAHHIWNARIWKQQPEYKVFQLHDVKDWGDIHYENQRSSFEITSSIEDFDRRVDYDDSKGQQYTNTVQDIIFHIINHSTYHRGQLAMDFRTHGIEPLITDYVHYKR
ncbi:DinB family protein [Pareuzebyella sediminis]|uniref:DinB family protein n=1 Tax=Pareuzebyella sediminis TaxID=2607998 RepID=UPI0011ECBD10|nr:DinB family protein [Pareuzebyella sediminis]